MKTLYLHPDTWDLEVDSYGNIAVADAPYAIAQDVASACKLWKGEALYDTTRGIPYDSVLGNLPPSSLLSGWYKKEAQPVPEVDAVSVSLNYDARQLSGAISLSTPYGEIHVAI